MRDVGESSLKAGPGYRWMDTCKESALIILLINQNTHMVRPEMVTISKKDPHQFCEKYIYLHKLFKRQTNSFKKNY